MNSDLVKKLYDHWSYLPLCIYCFVGILATMFYAIKLFSELSEPNDLLITIILAVTSVGSGIYIKVIGDMESNIVINNYIDSVPDDRKDLAGGLF